MILVTAKAGGIATTGTKRILDIVPKDIHGRSSVYLGSKDDVLDVIKFYEAEAKSG
jgi:fructose-1,6-bisphosphatase I